MTNEFDGQSTFRLDMIYVEWLEANDLEMSPADEHLMFNRDLTNRQREWLEDFCAAWRTQSEREKLLQNALDLCRKWVSRFGLGFHIDTSPAEYSPPLKGATRIEYLSDMARLWEIHDRIGVDPYEAGLNAMRAAGLIEEDA